MIDFVIDRIEVSRGYRLGSYSAHLVKSDNKHLLAWVMPQKQYTHSKKLYLISFEDMISQTFNQFILKTKNEKFVDDVCYNSILLWAQRQPRSYVIDSTKKDITDKIEE